MKADSTLNKVKILLGMEVKLEERKLENGTRFEADKFEKGNEVFIISDDDSRIAVPSGEYELEDGQILVIKEDGIIDEVKDEVEVPVEEEVMEVEDEEVDEIEAKDDEADVEDWAGMEKRIKNLEDAIADLKSRFGEDKDYMEESKEESKEELTEEIQEEKIEMSEEVKPFKHNPEKENKKEMNLYSQNKPMTTEQRVFNKLFNN
tara:strand:- start:128 stop:742 length:615 start_codon:yes stop_codon:yes gene_type:complete